MWHRLTYPLGRKIGLGLFGAPVWVIALTLLLAAAAAGQAVGPVLAGSIAGSVGMTVEQAVTLDTTVVNNPGFGDQDGTLGETNEPGDGVATRNDDGSSFTIAMELRAGDTVRVNLYLQNEGTATTSAILALNAPKGIDVDVDEVQVDASGGTITDNGVSEAQLARNQWLLSLSENTGEGDDDGISILIRPTRLIKPGFYTITGRLFQIEG